MKEHFHKHYLKQEKEINNIKREGVIWVLIGAAILAGILYGLVHFEIGIINAFLTILEVPSWFLMWEGMSKILFEARNRESEFMFYHKMANAHFLFKGY